MTRKKLLVLASEAGIVNRYRMDKDSLVEALVVSQIYRSLPESPGIMYDLDRRDLLQLCELAGEKVKRNSRKADLIHALEERISGMQRRGETDRVVSETPEPLRVEPLFTRGGPGGSDPLAELSGLPESFAESRVVLLPVHPYLVHVYWEVANSDIQKARVRFGRERSRLQPVLRFFDVSMAVPDSVSNNAFFDVKIELEAGQWYVDLWSPHRSYYVELGLETERGRFLPLCRSKVVETPPAWPSTEEDERYARLDDDGELIEVEVTEATTSRSFPVAVAAWPHVEDASEQSRILEVGSESQHLAVGQDEPGRSKRSCNDPERGESPAREEGPHTPSSVPVTSDTWGLDLTEMCERMADLGMSSRSKLCAREDSTSNS